MTVEQLVADLTGHGVELWLEEGRLRCRGPEEDILPQLYTELRRRKSEVVEVLAARAGRDRVEPLSYSQRSLWLMHQLAPRAPAYNVNAAVQLENPDPAALQSAVDALVSAHEVLRTVYRVADGAPVQVVLDHLDVPVVLETLEPGDDLALVVAAEVDAPLALEDRPLRVKLLRRVDDREAHLVLTVHHIACDFWSLQRLLADLAAAYAQARAGAPAQINRPTESYLTHMRSERARLAGPREEILWRFWRDQVGTDPPAISLPTDWPRPREQTFRGATLTEPISRDQHRALQQASRDQGVTPFMFLLAVFEALLARYSAQDDFFVGLATAGRARAETRDVVGNFVNMLPLRADVSGDPTFPDLLKAVRRRVLLALEHEDYPFARLVERLAQPRDHSRSPIFQVVYNWNQQSGPTVGADIALEGSSTGRTGAPYELTLTVTAFRDGLTLAWNYNADLFGGETMAAMAAAFRCLLDGVLQDPGQPVSSYPLLSAPHQREMLTRLDARRPETPPPCLLAAFDVQVRIAPEQVAVAHGPTLISYAELDRRAQAVTAAVTALGVRPGARVGLYCARGPGLVAALLGVLRSPAAFVPLDRGHPLERLRGIVADAGVSAIVGEPGPLIAATGLPQIPPWIDDEAARPVTAAPSPSDLAYIIYTSGSEGRPKGVCIERGSLAAFVHGIGQALELSATDRVLATTTPAFDISLLELVAPLASGARVVIPEHELAQSPRALLAEAKAAGVTLMQFTPAGWRVMLDANAGATTRMKLVCGGEALPADLAVRLQGFGARAWNAYGPTETTVWVGASPLTPEAEATATGKAPRGSAPTQAPIGAPLEGVAWYVLDERRRPIPPGAPGELHIAGRVVGRGYWGQPDRTAESFFDSPFDGEPMFRTGDRVRLRADGRLDYLGRGDHQVKVRGYRVEPAEVEAALRAEPGVQQAVVIPRSMPDGSTSLVGYVVARPGVELSIQAIREHTRVRLPDYMVPAWLVVLEAFPLTPSGKLDRRALPAPDTAQHFALGAYVEPRSETERWLCALWAQVLGLDATRIGVDQNFFELGGHSLLLVQAWSRIAERFGREIELVDLYRHATVRDLAACLDTGPDAPPADMEVRQAELMRRYAQAFGAQPDFQAHLMSAEGSRRVEVLDMGAGPAVALFPPSGCLGTSYLRQAPVLAARYRLLIFHPPGCGQTSRERSMDIVALARDVAETLKNLGVVEPCHVVGWSLGGLMAQALALEHPGAVRSLTLVSSAASRLFGESTQDARRLTQLVAEDLRDNRAPQDDTLPSDLAALIRSPGARSWDGSVAGWPDLAPRLRSIRAPALVIAGGRDAITPAEASRGLAERLPAASYEELPDGGHFLPLLNPAWFNDRLLAFLQAVELLQP